jgi:lauroyl/myristoyl acyltransferase
MRRRLLLMLVRAVGLLTFKAAGRRGQIAGRLGCRINSREAQTARINLALRCAKRSLAEPAALLRQSLAETGPGLAQMLRPFGASPLCVDDLIDGNGIVQACRDGIAGGQGLIVALSHLGDRE